MLVNLLFSLISPKAKEDVKKHKELELDSELDQFIEDSSSKSILSIRSMGNFGKRIASAVTNTASSALSHTASAVKSAVGRTDSSLKIKEVSYSLEKRAAFDIQETAIDAYRQ